MGYRSEWQLLVKGKKEAVERFVAHLKAESEKPENKDSTGKAWGNFTRASTFETILECEEGREDLGDGEVGLHFGHTATKCYPPWEEVIQELVELAEDKLGLEIAYGELGEDMEDSTFISNGDLFVSYTRILDGPGW